jgi:hypothetical protein
MFETLATFHLPMLTLKVAALLNIDCMLETDATFHAPMSRLNAAAS